MRLERGLTTNDLSAVPAEAARHEAAGLDGTFTFDGPHDPFLPVVLAAGTTSSIRLSTQIAVAFGRSPFITAQSAQDLQRITDGRFALGLGTQIRPHITRRFSMPWSKPVERMREHVGAVRAIWEAWTTGTEPSFEGEFFTHTLLPPFFHPGPTEHPDPPILLAGVGPRMVALAGEVSDGLIVHPFHSRDSLREITLTAFDRGLAASGRTRSDVEVLAQTMLAIGDDQEAIDRARQGARAQIGFYGSTPAYRDVLDLHGFGELQPRLRELTRAGDWGALVTLVPDELVDLIVVSGTPEDAAVKLDVRNGDVADTTSLVLYDETEGDGVARLVAALRS